VVRNLPRMFLDMRMPLMPLVYIVGLLVGISVIMNCSATEAAQAIRQPLVAGSFYPGDAKTLASDVDNLVAHAAIPARKEQIIALIAPHAGYAFSGAVAAHSYALLRGQPVHRVVVIAPSHFEAIPFSSVYEGEAYATPLGNVPVDKEFARKLASSSPLIKLSRRGHAPSQGQGEHALEVQIPFLQRTLSDFLLVPVVMGDQSYEASRALGVALAELSRGSDTLIVASSDLSHYHTYDEASALDRKTLNAIREWDYLTLSKNFQGRIWEACGGGPIVAATMAAERLGATKAEVLKYANTGDVTGDHSRVVGYGAVAMFRDAKDRKAERTRFSLSQRDRKELLEIARKSVESAVKENKLFQPSENLSEPLMEDRAAFVTITKKGELRGCVGYTGALQSLALTVRDVAALAALRDPRFPPVNASELPNLKYEISVLSPLHRVSDSKQIRLGEHGVLMKKGDYEGLLLPQVASEEHWDRNTLLEQTALKAGLPVKAWRDKETDIFVFTALVFGESTTLLPFTPEDPFSRKPSQRPGGQEQDLPPR
jgi:AmmeMemoRadiSam system protein B/AmmeMemoRadiSam system protein A